MKMPKWWYIKEEYSDKSIKFYGPWYKKTYRFNSGFCWSWGVEGTAILFIITVMLIGYIIGKLI